MNFWSVQNQRTEMNYSQIYKLLLYTTNYTNSRLLFMYFVIVYLVLFVLFAKNNAMLPLQQSQILCKKCRNLKFGLGFWHNNIYMYCSKLSKIHKFFIFQDKMILFRSNLRLCFFYGNIFANGVKLKFYIF